MFPPNLGGPGLMAGNGCPSGPVYGPGAAFGTMGMAPAFNPMPIPPPPPICSSLPWNESEQSFRRLQADALNYEPPTYGPTFDDRFPKKQDLGWMPELGVTHEPLNLVATFKDRGIVNPGSFYTAPKIEPVIDSVQPDLLSASIVRQTSKETVWQGAGTSHFSFVRDEGYHVSTAIPGLGKKEELLNGYTHRDPLSDFS